MQNPQKIIIKGGWISVCIFTTFVALYLIGSSNYEGSQSQSSRNISLIVLLNALITSSICILVLKYNLRQLGEGWKNKVKQVTIYLVQMVIAVVAGQFLIAFAALKVNYYIFGVDLVRGDTHGTFFMLIIAMNSVFIVVSILLGIVCIASLPANSQKKMSK